MRFLLFCDFSQRRFVVFYRHFGTNILKGQAVQEDGTDRLSRNVGNELPIYAAINPILENMSFTPRRKPKITHDLKMVTLTLLRRYLSILSHEITNIIRLIKNKYCNINAFKNSREYVISLLRGSHIL
jgi:hypothetical protein